MALDGPKSDFEAETGKKSVKMIEETAKLYSYQEPAQSASFSVYPAVPAVVGNQLDIAAAPLESGKTISITPQKHSAYRWLAPTSKHFAEILITVSAQVKKVFGKASRFISRAVKTIAMNLTIHRTVFLRL